MANDSILPSSVAVPHLTAFEDLAVQRFAGIDYMAIQVYLLDTVPAAALPALAEQFHILGYEGWRFAITEAQQRDLLKRSIPMHRVKGTRWSISEAVKMLGFPGATFVEGGIIFYDGSYTYDGSFSYGSCWWALFNVILDATGFGYITPAIALDARNIINEWKPLSRRLVSVVFAYNFTINTTLSAVQTLLPELFDGSRVFDGSFTYGNGLLEFVQFGTSGAPSALTITSPIDKAPLVTYPAIGVIQVEAELSESEGNGVTFQEYGLQEFITGNLFDRQVQPPILKDNTMRIRAVWTINYV